MVAPVNVRLHETTQDRLVRYAHTVGRTRSSVINMAVDEWLRMQAHPRIRFVTIETGERRAILADGPAVWTVAEAWLQHEPEDRTVSEMSVVTGLSEAAIDAALAYWADYREEIDAEVERQHVAQDEALAAWERRRALDAV